MPVQEAALVRREVIGWDPGAADNVTSTEPPTDEQIEVKRELDVETAVARRESS